MKTLATASLCLALGLTGGALLEAAVGLRPAVAKPNNNGNGKGPFQGGNRGRGPNPSRGNAGQNSGNLSKGPSIRSSSIRFAPAP